ncbi:MAG: hypothetical protein HPPSJP_3320 [Candidatus Hepatoplasma scabrum]|nr:MAG: hypothetical protein HPPSJP_3320 [Candidatus Hepatoplasma sp.]
MEEKLERESVERIKLVEFFNNQSKYYIPKYQRKYVWKKNNIESLWDDILNLIENDEEKINLYLGNILINIDKNGKKWVIDGQQRLITFNLLFKAILDEINDQKYYGIENIKNNLSKFIYYSKFGNIIYDKLIKLNLSDNKNQKDFREILSENFFQERKNSFKKRGNFYENYFLWREKINNFLDEYDVDDFFKSFKKIWVIKINLQKNDNELKIFETLNSKGTSLSVTDLIKNLYFMRLHEIEKENNINENEISELDNFIKLFFESILFEKMSEWNDKNLNLEFTKLIKEYIIYKSVWSKNNYLRNQKLPKEKDSQDLYEKFKLVLEAEFNNLKTENDIDESISNLNKFLLIKKSIKDYKNMSGKRGKLEDYEISFMLFNNLFTGSQFFPILVQLINNKENVELNREGKIIYANDDFKKSISLLEKMFIKRTFCGKGTRLLTRTINKIKVSDYESLLEEFADHNFIPRNYEFKEGLKKSDNYNGINSEILKGFFWKIELMKYEDNYESINYHSNKDKFEIDHIMPQKLNYDWKKDLGEDVKDYQKHLNKIGNLTITANNKKIGNKGFKDKREFYAKGNVKLNKEISNLSDWNFKEIDKRTDNLIDSAIKIWE